MKLVRISIILIGIMLLAGLAYTINRARNRPDESGGTGLTFSRKQPKIEGWLDISVFEGLFGPSFSNSLSQIEANWNPGYAPLLFESTRMMADRAIAEQTFAVLKKMTRVRAQPGELNQWLSYIYSQQAQTPPWYSDFKAFIYKRKDEDFAKYFEGNPATEIRLEEVIWGGVVRDGIPPLNNPTMIAAEEAIYLDDSDVTFGISINGDPRAYPKRILAWHEMFKDTIGGQSVCGVY